MTAIPARPEAGHAAGPFCPDFSEEGRLSLRALFPVPFPPAGKGNGIIKQGE
jgi:hypothetical protein